MADRRTLIEAMNTPAPVVDPSREKEFVFGAKTKVPAEVNQTAPTAPAISRSPLSTRIRGDLSEALKRASLERQLKKIEPNTLCDILEEAIEPWLKSNGYLP